MNGQAESDNKRLDKLEAWQDTFQERLKNVEKLCEKISEIDRGLGLLRQGIEDYKELADERHEDLGAGIKGVKAQGWAIIIMILTAAVVAIITNALK